jgi:hydroxymethylbilane synthase
VLRLGTRGSALAVAQSSMVAAMLGGAELVSFSTRGDRTRGALTEIGGKGLFTAELEAALRDGQIHLAVHSAKDMPARMDSDLVIAAAPAREDARDVLVSLRGLGPESLPRGARVGTSSHRRAVELRELRKDLQALPLRGNVETRLRKLREGQYDAIVLAYAGLKRLGLADELAGMVFPLELNWYVPAAGQGALAVQCLASDRATRAALKRIDDEDSHQALLAERSVVAGLKASCQSALGVNVRRISARRWRGDAMAADSEGKQISRVWTESPSAQQVGRTLLKQLREAGAEKLLRH